MTLQEPAKTLRGCNTDQLFPHPRDRDMTSRGEPARPIRLGQDGNQRPSKPSVLKKHMIDKNKTRMRYKTVLGVKSCFCNYEGIFAFADFTGIKSISFNTTMKNHNNCSLVGEDE